MGMGVGGGDGVCRDKGRRQEAGGWRGNVREATSEMSMDVPQN